MKSLVTDIEFLSKTRQTYSDELSFVGRGLKLNTRADAQELCKSIAECKSMKVLRLEGNTISPEAADELSKQLIKHPELERFIANDIFTGRLKDEIPLALKSMCGAIDRSGAHLVEINMSDNAYGPIGLDALVDFFTTASCFSLREIRMHNNGLGPQGSQKFANALDKCLTNSKGSFKLKVFVCGRNRLELEGARSIGSVLKKIGTLEEIQMPQNGIRPNAIEFLADACLNNPNLRTVNFNDNTFLKSGAEQMSKALIKLKHLEYLNLGDCLLKSKGSLLITKAVCELEKLKEIVLSFNEINLQSGIEIAQILAKKSGTKISLIDLNGNKFGEDGKVEIQEILEEMKDSLGTMSEDEGSDEEDEGEDEDVEDEEESEEDTSEVVVDEEEDYDQVENEDYEEYEEDLMEQKFGCMNVVQQQQPSLFTQFKPPTSNLFSSLVKNNALVTNIKIFDDFVLSPTISNLSKIDAKTIEDVIKHQKFNGAFLFKLLSHIGNLYDKANEKILFDYVDKFFKAYLQRESAKQGFVNEMLIEFGVLKSEDKNFKPIELNDKICALTEHLFKQSYVPSLIRETVKMYINLRSQQKDEKFNRKNSDLLLKCLG